MREHPVRHLKVSPESADGQHMARSRLRTDGGGIVLGWLLKLTVVLLLVGIVAYDVVSVSYAKVATSDDARYIALGASEAIVLQRADNEKAISVARDRAETRGVTLTDDDISISRDGVVTVTVQRDADTLIASRIGPLEPYTHVTETFVTPAIK